MTGADLPPLSERFRPTPLEVTAGRMIGIDPLTVPLPRQEVPASPRRALESSLLTALQRPPCVVSFSGGRDSSAVLAVASLVARREGLPLPIPATLIYPKLSETDETEWQDAVIRHLHLPDWERVELHDELDVVGPVSDRLLVTHGVRWPPNAHMEVPMVARATGGTLLSGVGGDEVLGTPGSRLMKVIARRASLRPRDTLRLGYAALPSRVRARVMLGRQMDDRPWLTAEGARMVDRAVTRWEATVPERWNAALDAWWRTRELQSSLEWLSYIGEAADVRISHPFMEPPFLIAMRNLGGVAGFAGRTEVMRELFADVLPDATLSRVSKAIFGRAVRSTHTTSFATEWDGTGLEELPVHAEVLRGMWLSSAPCFQTFFLLQTAWLATRSSGGDDVEQPATRLRD